MDTMHMWEEWNEFFKRIEILILFKKKIKYKS